MSARSRLWLSRRRSSSAPRRGCAPVETSAMAARSAIFPALRPMCFMRKSPKPGKSYRKPAKTRFTAAVNGALTILRLALVARRARFPVAASRAERALLRARGCNDRPRPTGCPARSAVARDQSDQTDRELANPATGKGQPHERGMIDGGPAAMKLCRRSGRVAPCDGFFISFAHCGADLPVEARAEGSFVADTGEWIAD